MDMFARHLEEILAEVERLLSQISGTKEILTVPGVAVVTLAGFLAEVGDLRGYEHGQQIIRLAGLNLKENSSGKKKGKSSIPILYQTKPESTEEKAIDCSVLREADSHSSYARHQASSVRCKRRFRTST